MTARLRRSLLVRVYTTPRQDGIPLSIYRVYDLKTGEELQFSNWGELRVYLERRWPRRLR